ncbi:excalibur calcium-binding domain-containing protein [Luteococcus peritonei]|uniref:Excalibur calcium-binding domain-containing protein n=1 Tax=Luteococcus peritonei TaxID=88874 RepID=A0ABW4RV90_9ACTN
MAAAAPAAAPETSQRSTSKSTSQGLVGSRSGSGYYKNCAAARAAGVAPLHRGDPGYRAGLDRDDDGVACE